LVYHYYLTSVNNQVTITFHFGLTGCKKSRNFGTSGLRASPGMYQVGSNSGITWDGSSVSGDLMVIQAVLPRIVTRLTPAVIEVHSDAGYL